MSACCISRKKCFAEGCPRRIPRHLLMCRVHWQMVSHPVRVEVYAGLDKWQSGGSPRDYLDAIRRAHREVAQEEAQR